MTPLQRVRRTRAVLLTTVVVRALLWGAAAGVGVIVIAGVFDLILDLPRAVRGLILPLAVAAAIAVAVILLWRGRRARAG
jgi:hypothetical protein